MKVVYDITALGNGFYNNSVRTGIFRAVENLACGLLNTKQCDLSFCAYTSVTDLMEAAKYLANSTIFKGVPLCMPGDGKSRITLKLLSKVLPPPGKRNGPRECLLFLLRFMAKRSGIVRPGVDTEMLHDADILHSTFWPLPDPSSMPAHVKRFITIHDLIPIIHPEFFEGNMDHTLHKVMRSIRPDDYVLTISEATKNDLCKHFSIDPNRVFVTPLAAGESFYRCRDEVKLSAVREKYGIPDAPYLLSLSTLEPRKNLALLIRCFKRFVDEAGISDLNLVLVGSKGWDYGGIFDELKASVSVRDRIIVTGYVADEDLAAVYSGALMFVYPSFYEGFGLPPLEAMQCGVPVITSNTSSLPEVVGNAGIMVDPTDADAFCQSIADLYSDADKREELGRKSLERAKDFSWSICAARTLDAYQAVLP